MFFLAPDDETAVSTHLRGPGEDFESGTCRSIEPDSAIAEWDMYFAAPSAEAPPPEQLYAWRPWPEWVTAPLNDGNDRRTPRFFALNYLSRYHLTQLLLPALRRAERSVVLMMTAAVSPTEEAGFARFPDFTGFHFKRDRKPVQLGNHHYAAHLTRTELGLAAGVINAGAVKTDTMRAAPWYMRAGAKVLGPIIFESVETAAHDVVEATRQGGWQSPLYWGKPGRSEQRVPITVDTSTTQTLMDTSRTLTGA